MALLAASLMATTSILPTLTTPAYAQSNQFAGQQGSPLMKGLSGPDELAKLIDASLAKDPTGNGLLDEKRCKLNGSCATPNIYLEGIRRWHPNVSVTLQGLPIYIRGLKNAVTTGEFYSARMVGRKLDLDSGFKRKLMSGEYAWYDTQTGDAILFENCGNIMRAVEVHEVVVEAKQPCEIINTFTDADSGLHLAVMLSEGELFKDSHHCLAYKLAGQTTFTPGLPKSCNPLDCKFDDAEAVTGLKASLFGNADHLNQGDQMFRVPAGTRVAFCYTDSKGQKYRTQIIVPEDYKHGEAWILRFPDDKPGAFALYWKLYRH